MTPQPDPASVFTLLRFTLVRNDGGLLTQRREHLGTFATPESAFSTAKTQAWLALRRLALDAGSALAAHQSEMRVCDTEWGYDLRRDGQVIDRFWVHDHNPRTPL